MSMAGESALLGPVMCGVEPGGNLSCSEQAVGKVFLRAGHISAPAFPLSLC